MLTKKFLTNQMSHPTNKSILRGAYTIQIKHNAPGHIIYAHLSYHIDFEIALKYYIDLGNIRPNYRISYRI